MITDANTAQATARSVISRPLKRGRACMNCRFLKIKCDGIKPICGPCRKHPKDDDCEYSDGPTRSRTKALEDTVQRLEARLHELEHPEESTPSVTLYDPYAPYPPPPPPAAPRLVIPHHAQGRLGSLPGTPFSTVPRLLTPGGSLSSSSPESQGLAPLSPFSPPASTPPYGPHGSSPLGIFDSRVAVATPESRSSEASNLEFDPQLCDALIQRFLPHATQFGFFLDPQRFQPPSSPGTPPTPVSTRTAPALLYALCTWGAHLMGEPEDPFKFRALQACGAELSAHPSTLLHTLQAEILLAYYFWRTGALLKARVHAAAAGAIALGAGLDRVRAAHPAEPLILELGDRPYAEHSPYSYSGAGETRLPAPADPVEEGERIRGFWAVFVLQKALAVALEPPTRLFSVFESVQIDTPWPRDIEEYKHGLIGSDVRGESTVKRYLNAASTEYDAAQGSLDAMLVKAHILLHRAMYMESQWTPGVSQREQEALTQAYHSIGGLIQTLRAQLPSRQPSHSSPVYSQASVSSQSSSYSHSSHSQSPVHEFDAQTQGRVRLAHALLDGAVLRLQGIFMYTDTNARARCVHAAMDMLRDAPSVQSEVSPIIGTVWAAAVRVLADELKHLRSQGQALHQHQQHSSHGSGDEYEYEYEQDVAECLHEGLEALQSGARESVMMRHHMGLARDAGAGSVAGAEERMVV